MKIVRFRAINYKGIKQIEIIPEGNLVIVSGKNGAGKSSTLDGIKNILAGKDKITKHPIRNGEDRAELELDIEGQSSNGIKVNYKIKKVFTENGEQLQIINNDGLKYPSPQSFLNKLTGSKSFDPNEFLNKSEKEQREELIKFSGIDLAKEDRDLQDIYDQRHQVGIEGKALAQYNDTQIQEAKEYENIEEINISDLTNKLEVEQNKHREYNSAQNELLSNDEKIKNLENQIQLIKVRNELLKDIKKPESNIEEIKIELNTADDKNKKIRQSKQILENNEKVISKKKEWIGLDLQYKEKQNERQQLLSAMELPLDGLVVTEDEILFNNVPIKQLSTSEAMKIAIAMYIETCVRDGIELKLVTIKNGNDFDDDSIKIIAEIVDGYEDLTMFIERVVNSENEAVGIYIEEGVIIKK